jgi:hypothetical protein
MVELFTFLLKSETFFKNIVQLDHDLLLKEKKKKKSS